MGFILTFEMVTKEQAQVVKQALFTEAEPRRVGTGLSKSGEDWVVILFLPHEFPPGTFPSEKDGVKIITEITGPVTSR